MADTYDMAALHSQMADAFGGSGSEDPPGGTGGLGNDTDVSPQPGTTPTTTSTPTPDPSQITQAEWDALPKAWKQDYKDKWAGIDPEVRKYVHEREKQAADGITRYKQGHESWSKVTSDFQQLMQEHPDADFAEIARATTANHIRMLQATPEERVRFALELAAGYEISPQQLLAAIHAASGGGGQPAVSGGSGAAPGQPIFSPEQMAWMERTFGPVVQATRQTSEFVQNQQREAQLREIDAFFRDPKNEFAAELGNDILAAVKSGVRDLSTAYQLALVRNPEVRAKWVAKQAAALAPKPGSTTNLKSSSPAAPPATPGDMDATMDAIVKKHYG